MSNENFPYSIHRIGLPKTGYTVVQPIHQFWSPAFLPIVGGTSNQTILNAGRAFFVLSLPGFFVAMARSFYLSGTLANINSHRAGKKSTAIYQQPNHLQLNREKRLVLTTVTAHRDDCPF